jgi:hypothetical protein
MGCRARQPNSMLSVAGRLLPAGHTCGEFLLAPSFLAHADRVPGDRKRAWQDCDRRHAVSPRLRFCAPKRAFPPRAVRVEVREVSTIGKYDARLGRGREGT